MVRIGMVRGRLGVRFVAILAVFVLVVAACGGDDTEATEDVTAAEGAADHCEGMERYTVYFATFAYTHPFFEVMEKGANEAGVAACIDVIWTQDPVDFSIPDTVNRMDAAIATSPDLLVVSVGDPAAMKGSLDRAAEAGIPVITVNASDLEAAPEDNGYMFYVGADEYLGGVTAARLILSRGVDGVPVHAVCYIDVPGALQVESRCQGFADTMEEAGAQYSRVDICCGSTQAEAAVDAHMLANPDVDAALGVDPSDRGVLAILNVIEKQGRTGEVDVMAFDLGPEIVDHIKDGTLIATIDQQQYLQGYMPVIWARLFLDWGLLPGADVLTGPGIVDINNIELLEEGVAALTR